MRRSAALCTTLAALLVPASAAADTFQSGSLIIPMDTDYQDMGMLEAFGLVYELLRSGVPVRWVIKDGKVLGDADFVASSIDLRTGTVITDHGYRGGPWVIDSSDAADALPVIQAWQAGNPDTAVHEASAMFSGDVARVLVVAPTIAMFADGNQNIARKYVQAAKIPDSVGDYGWPDTSPDMLDVDEVSGPTETDHQDGALFDEDGDPVYCQLMSMHWGVNDAENDPEVVAEVRAYLGYPVHFFAECQAVNAFENLDPHGFFLTEHGFEIDKKPVAYDFYQQDTPFAQLDGPFVSVKGSEESYSLPAGDSYKASDIVMITEAGTPVGVADVWMTGVLDGICPGAAHVPWVTSRPDADHDAPPSHRDECLTKGKVSYLGGHEYKTSLPISGNPDTQGTRLFLNSLFEAPCATADGLPAVVVQKDAPAFTASPTVTFSLDYQNNGPTTALDVVLSDEIPPGSTFVSATGGGVLANGIVTWDLGNLGAPEGGTVSFTVDLGQFGSYENMAQLDYRVGLNAFFVESNLTTTVYDLDTGTGTDTSGGTGTGGSGGTDTSGGTGTGSSSGTGTSGGTGSDTGSSTGTGTSGGASSDTGTGTGSSGGSGGGGTSGGTGEGTGNSGDSSADGGDSGGGTDGDDQGSGEGETAPDGCGCRHAGSRPFGLAVLLGLVLRRRRRRARAG